MWDCTPVITRGTRYVEAGYGLLVQAKSSTRATLTENAVLYDLEVKNYDDLRDPALSPYRILVLLTLPDDEELWTDQNEERLLLRSCAYWMSLVGAPETTNHTTIQVAIPRANLFSVGGLAALMEKVRKG